MNTRLPAVLLALSLTCGASALAQHTEFRFDRHMASGGKPGSMFWWEYHVAAIGTATLVGGWCYDAGMNAPGQKWYFTLTGRPEDKVSDAAHMLTPASREFLRQCADAAKAEMQLSGRERFALVLAFPDGAVSAPARLNEATVE